MTTERDKNESENGSEILFVNDFMIPLKRLNAEVTDFIIKVRGTMCSSSREQRKITPSLVEFY